MDLDKQIDISLYSLGRDFRANKEPLKEALEKQKIEDMITIKLMEELQKKDKFIDLNIEEIINLLNEDINIWLKGQLCDTLCDLKNGNNQNYSKVYDDITLIKKDLEIQRREERQIQNMPESLKEDIRLCMLWVKKPASNDTKKRY